ncbi:MAG: glycine cleavage system aminomethyltransferase GcvT, partial [Candidatus Omnitrophica bacterium]|nr:glycine cleavage system aminomethyltransferase GcvT [Candidatus Omnitrophota bacterium]
MTETHQTLKKTPLCERHASAGAKMVPFAGWYMPVQYAGIIEEHMHTRSKVSLFDICHMGEFFVTGTSAEKDIDKLVTCRIDDLVPGKARYGFLLNADGGIIDDLIVFKKNTNDFMLVVNAGTIAKDAAWIKKNISAGTSFSDESEKMAKLDLQGPLADDVIKKLVDVGKIDGLKRFNFIQCEIKGVKVTLSRTGYTGENGFEIFFPSEKASVVWDTLLGFNDVKPVGLGARDTLRLEMGYSLYGSDIDEKHTPVDAGLLRFVYMEKDFIGKKSLLKQVETGSKIALVGFTCEGRRSARSHFEVHLRTPNPQSRTPKIGDVTSG